jgi:hypothetical protein
VNQKADLELLAARGLNDWEKADDELRETHKQARTAYRGEERVY